MTYQVRFTKDARKQFEKLKDEKLKERIASILEYLGSYPLAGKMLHGEFKGCRTYKTFSFRIIYQIFHSELVIVVLKIQHRRDVYQ